MTNMSEDTQSIKDQYNYVAYPEDVKERKEFRKFSDEFKQFSPVRNPEPEESYEEEELGDVDEPTPYKDTEYGKRPSFTIPRPITKDEARKKREWDCNGYQICQPLKSLYLIAFILIVHSLK